MEHPPKGLYTLDEFGRLLFDCSILEMACGNVFAVERFPTLEEVPYDNDAPSTDIDLERRLYISSGLVEIGSHIILDCRRGAQHSLGDS